jgi:hypothetical protein
MDGNVCDTIFKNLFIDEIICGGEVNVTIEEGEAITLMHNCIIDTSRVNMVIWEDPELNEIEGFNPTIVPTVPGPYVFIFEYEGTFCAGESIVNISFSTTTSTEETLEDKIKLYPNPARDHIYIDMAEDRKVQLSVLNFNGELLKQKTINQDDYLSLADFPNGVYLLKIETEQGHSFNKKIVKIK